MNDHFSIDLETLGTRYNAAILSIGVQQFDIDSGKLGETFYREIDIDSAIKAGKVTGSTLAWWAQQGEVAKRVFGSNGKTPLSVALDELLDVVRAARGEPTRSGDVGVAGRPLDAIEEILRRHGLIDQ